MKRLFLLLLIFSVNFVKPADTCVSEKAKKAFWQASQSDKMLIVNHLLASYKLMQSAKSGVAIGRIHKAAEGYLFLISNEDIKNYLSHVDFSKYLGLAKQVYNSIDDKYKKEQGDNLLNPYE